MRFDQVKLVSVDVRTLVEFYVQALECTVVTPPTVFDDPALARAIGAPGATVELAMVALSDSREGPVLEIYSLGDAAGQWPFQPGQGQIAFQVDDVEAMVDKILSHGGSMHGEVTDWRAPSGNLTRFVYMRDPEGNIIDLWARVERQSGSEND